MAGVDLVVFPAGLALGALAELAEHGKVLLGPLIAKQNIHARVSE